MPAVGLCSSDDVAMSCRGGLGSSVGDAHRTLCQMEGRSHRCPGEIFWTRSEVELGVESAGLEEEKRSPRHTPGRTGQAVSGRSAEAAAIADITFLTPPALTPPPVLVLAYLLSLPPLGDLRNHGHRVAGQA